MPNVVGAIERSQRALELTVTVKTEGGQELPATVTARERTTPPEPSGVRVWDDDSFLAHVSVVNEGEWWPNPEPGLRRLLGFLRDRPDDFVIHWGKGKKSACFMVDCPTGPTRLFVASQNGRLDVPASLTNRLGVRFASRIDAFRKARGADSDDVQETAHGICLGIETLDLNHPEQFEAVTTLLDGLVRDLRDTIGA